MSNPIIQYKFGVVNNPKEFVSTWKTDNIITGSTTATQIKLPLVSSGIYSFRVFWGDDSFNDIRTWNDANATHTYSTAGTYTVTIKGILIGISFNGNTDRFKITTITKWGNLRLGNTGNYFNDCQNLVMTNITDILDLTGTTTLAGTFFNCLSISTVGRMNEWNTSKITDMSNMFHVAGSSTNGIGIFNQNIGNWDTGKVTTFAGMFRFTALFNNGGSPDIGNWNMSSATNTQEMFSRANSFNQPLANWERSTPGNVSTMGNVTTMWNMFSSGMRSYSFNQPIGNWNVGNCTNFGSMFYRCPFNQNVGAWNMSKATNINSMFAGSGFFFNSFNNGGSDTIKNWNVSNVTDMGSFAVSSAFNQPIGSWNIVKVTNLGTIGGSLTTATLDNVYNGWSLLVLKPNLTLNSGTVKYSSASSSARAILAGSPNNWILTDGGLL